MTKKEEYKRIFYRFLKECGLFVAFKRYLKQPKSEFIITEYIDDILGESHFTSYLKQKENIVLPATSSDIFRFYILTIYGNKYKFHYTSLCEYVENMDDIKIDKKTGTIKISYKTNDKRRRN